MKFIIDVNLPPTWCSVLKSQGWEAIHWRDIGDIRAPDTLIMKWAREYNYIVFTHDLDFGTLLALTQAKGPSVIQVRTHDVTPATLGDTIIALLKQQEPLLEQGALMVVDKHKSRIRALPLT